MDREGREREREGGERERKGHDGAGQREGEESENSEGGGAVDGPAPQKNGLSKLRVFELAGPFFEEPLHFFSQKRYLERAGQNSAEP